MATFEDLRAIKGHGTLLDKLVPVPTARLEAIRKRFGEAPSDYMSFLEMVGAGELGESAFMLYDGLVQPEDVYGDAPSLKGVLLLGDDLQGFNAAFDTKDWSVVEIDPTNMRKNHLAPTFESFIRRKLEVIA
jgi:hypothetical protein